ncbi:lytic murein transglycosylase [Pelagibacteraceae bacterium]|nr:lytic murein transglycosylase [Pelagibacteraceae bacterium]
MVINLMSFFFRNIILYIFFKCFFLTAAIADTNPNNFQNWLIEYKKYALAQGVSETTLDLAFKNVKYLEKVIGYDRKQPEFYEDTLTYVNKRASDFRKIKARDLLKKNNLLFDEIERTFNVQKEILLALWGIETNFGKHVGKMDIISCLATLSFDKRRSEFFSSELITLLKLVDKKLIDLDTLYGSWAGAYGNFQFMPSTINNYAIDYDKNNKIELKTSLKDAVASAANYINKIGWDKNIPCFYRVKLTKEINKKYINTSARNISNRLKISKWVKKGIISFDGSELKSKYKAALVIPDGKIGTPSYLVFNNYEKILQWNRSLRFGISVCTLAEKIKT